MPSEQSGVPPPLGAPVAASKTPKTQSAAAPVIWQEHLAYVLPRQTLALGAAGATLGPLCDGLHSSHGVLHYSHPDVALSLHAGPLEWSLETCRWVPLLFGLAGIILGVGVPLLDRVSAAGSARVGVGRHQVQQQLSLSPPPSWTAVLACISAFVLQYAASAVLEPQLHGVPVLHGAPELRVLDALLAACAATHWAAFDGTAVGLGMAALTAVSGPAVEVVLINAGHLYSYSHPDVLGIPSWIAWTYCAGGPAVGNLGRTVWAHLERDAVAEAATAAAAAAATATAGDRGEGRGRRR
jgi:Insulin-induced protein (INSIG)